MDTKISPELEFETWMSDRHRWLQTAAADLLDARRFPNADEIAVLADLCKQEARKLSNVPYRTLAPGTYEQAAKKPTLRIERIFNVQGVAAIKNGASLDFRNANLSVVYGPNGSGKTGYSRLLKQVCGAKAREELRSNIFESDNPPTTAELEVVSGEISKTLLWKISEGACVPLRNSHVFDSKTALVYAFGKTEASYEPSRMRFVSSLIKICDAVSSLLCSERDGKGSRYPNIHPDLTHTPTGLWVSKLTAGLTNKIIEERCQYTEEHKHHRATLEAALTQKDIPGRLAAIARERNTIVQLQQMLQKIKSQYTREQLNAIQAARVDVNEKRTAATKDAQRLFAESNVEGIGTPSWRLFWQYAKKFSTEIAYVQKTFPHTDQDAHCLLCHQPLSTEAQQRLHHFEEYIKSHLEAEAEKAEKHLTLLIENLPNLPSRESWLLQTAASKCPEEAGKLFEHIAACRAFAEKAVKDEICPVGDWRPCEAACQEQLKRLLEEETSLKAIQGDDKRAEIIAQVAELRAVEWAAHNKEAIVSEVQRLLEISHLNKAISLTSTTALTKKNNDLAENELSTGYQVRFKDELARLGGSRLSVIPICKKEGKGKTTFGISLDGAKSQAKAEDILSEGETRIVALAAFLADITGANQATPFIFDDPISSLDQDFEERVTKRLVELSMSRQVIIFTHRLSLVSQVESEFRSLNNVADQLGRPALATMRIETLRRMNRHTGIVVPSRLRDQKPEKALNAILNDLIPQAKRLLSELNPEYERYALSICSDFRILVERSVEAILLNEVVMRFRRSVTTQNRIVALAKITVPDCKIFDDLMTKYSVYEHSQSDELAAPVPDLLEIESDIKSLATWAKEFNSRTVAVA